MGYKKIPNLQIDHPLFNFRECFATTKIHGTSASITFAYEKDKWSYKVFSGGSPYNDFLFMLNTKYKLATEVIEKLSTYTSGKEMLKIQIFGESYGGKQQQMGDVYGPPNFVAFEVLYPDLHDKDRWLSVEQADKFVTTIGLEFVPYERGPMTIEWLTAQRDKPDALAKRNGMGDKDGEGIVVRAPIELYDENGGRLIAKYKRDNFRETKTARTLTETDIKVLQEAEAIAEEWVVEERLNHVLSKLVAQGYSKLEMKDTGKVISAMVEDVGTEAIGQIEWSQEAAKAIGRKTAAMFKRRILGGIVNPIEGI